MADIRIEETKRGAPWMLVIVLLIIAAAIGWWLWQNRTVGEPTTGTPAATVADSTTAAPKTP